MEAPENTKDANSAGSPKESDRTLDAVRALLDDQDATVTRSLDKRQKLPPLRLEPGDRLEQVAAKAENTKEESITTRVRRAIGVRARIQVLKLRLALRDRIPNWRDITPRQIAVAVIILAVMLEPWFVPTVVLLTAFILSFVVLFAGWDRCVYWCQRGWGWYRRRNRARAEDIRLGYLRTADRLQVWIDRLPESWARAIHLPHWQSAERQDAADEAYSSRLARMSVDTPAKAPR